MNKTLIFIITFVILLILKNKKKNEQNKIIIDTVFLLHNSVRGVILKNNSKHNVNTRGMVLTYSSGKPVKTTYFKIPKTILKPEEIIIITGKRNEKLSFILRDVKTFFTDSINFSNKGFYLELTNSKKENISSFGKIKKGNIEKHLYGLGRAFQAGSIWKKFEKDYHRTFVHRLNTRHRPSVGSSSDFEIEFRKNLLKLIMDLINKPHTFYFKRKN